MKQKAWMLALLAVVLLVGCSGTKTGTNSPERIAVLRDSVATVTDFWPDYHPETIPLVIFYNDTTWLFGYPGTPEGFAQVTGKEFLVMPGQHSTIVANSSGEIDSVVVSTLLIQNGMNHSDEQWAAIAIHEGFHVWQNTQTIWSSNEANLFLYPFDNAEALSLRRQETYALQQAMLTESEEKKAWAAKAAAIRKQRLPLLGLQAFDYEASIELIEGSAYYVEWKARKAMGMSWNPVDDLPTEGFPLNKVRFRGYRTGLAWAYLLDEYAPTWKQDVMATMSLGDYELSYTPMFLLLARALPDVEPATIPDAVISESVAMAESDVDSLVSLHEMVREGFTTRQGWKVMVEAEGNPLWLQGFDPLNVENLGEGEVMHTRYLALGNANAGIKIMDGQALTLTKEGMPLFGGVQMLMLTGLEKEPTVEQMEGMDRLTFEGGSMLFKNAHIETEGMSITVVLPN